MSSSPSSVCLKVPSRFHCAGTSLLSAVSRSVRTSGSAFSLMVSDADVCWMNRLHMPMEICGSSELTAFKMSLVIKWHPREGAVTVICFWNQSDGAMLLLLLLVVVSVDVSLLLFTPLLDNDDDDDDAVGQVDDCAATK